MKYKNEELNFIYATCDQCEKVKKIPRKHLTRVYYGYKMEKLAQCSCGAVLSKIEGHDEESPCVHCGKDVSVHLHICPYCGKEEPHKIPKEKLNLKKIIPWIGILLVLVGLIAALFLKNWNQETLYLTDETGITQNGTIGVREEPVEKTQEEESPSEENQEDSQGEMLKKEGLSIYDGEGNYLGKLTTNNEDEESIFNETGEYGSPSSSTSIWNTASDYGAAKTSKSAFYEKASDPPQIYLNGEFLAYLTTNPYKKPFIHPDSLRKWLEEQGY